MPVLTLSLLAVLAAPPSPPAPLTPWVEYAKRLAPEQADCPPARACVQLQRLEVTGRPGDGRIGVRVSGSNLGRFEQRTILVQPASVFSVSGARFTQGQGSLVLDEGTWWLVVAPGPFAVSAELGFEPAASLTLDLGGPYAAVVDGLAAGHLDFDDSSDRHAGALTLVTTGSRVATEQPLSVRVVRAFTYGSVVTFSYDYVVTGLREQTRLSLPRLGEESFEQLEPDIPFTVTPTELVVTLSPGRNRLRATGHFPNKPSRFAKPATLPFEHWLVDVDSRHPAELSTSGLEINPSDVPSADVSSRSRGFLLMEQQFLEVKPLDVTVDRGQGGSGTARVAYVQGEAGRWVGTLQLDSTIRPDEDRVEIPTPAPPHYAEVGGAPVRMYGDDGTLSIRALAADGRLQPVKVQWREELDTNPVLSALTLSLPPQRLHLDSQSVDVGLLPGFVPLAVLGAESSRGDLLDGLHIYALLLAGFAVVLARTAGFPRWAVVIAGVLFVGLYSVHDFPREQLLFLLVGCAVLVRMPSHLLSSLRAQRRLYALVSLFWLSLLASALVPSVTYARERLLLALHPWSSSSASTSFSGIALPGQQAAPSALEPAPAAPPEELAEQDEGRGEASATPRQKLVKKKFDKLLGDGVSGLQGGGGGSLSGLAAQGYANVYARKGVADVQAQIIRPVAFESSVLPLTELHFELGSVLSGSRLETTVLVAGPWLRGWWLMAECAGLAALWVFVVLRARRLWARGEVA